MFIIKNILKNEYRFVGLYFLNTMFLIFMFNMILDDVYIVYPLIISIAFFCFYTGYMYFKYNKLITEIKNIKIQDYELKYTVDYKDQFYLDILKELHFENDRKINKLKENNKRNSFMFSQFIHNMKTSVSVIDLASNSTNENFLEDIILENNKLKEQLEQSLNILRLDEFSKDFLPEKQYLLKIVKTVINKNKTNFIYNNVFPKINVNEEEMFVLTDEKWCIYMVNQIVSNAIKYSKESGQVTFNIFNKDGKVTLQVVDDGVGIPPQDLDRVFELFYTGKNGRNNENSTGIGLAMVKNVATYLSVNVGLTSVVGKGTTVEIVFNGEIT